MQLDIIPYGNARTDPNTGEGDYVYATATVLACVSFNTTHAAAGMPYHSAGLHDWGMRFVFHDARQSPPAAAGTAGAVSCQHGPVECDLNKVLSCAIALNPRQVSACAVTRQALRHLRQLAFT